MYALRHDGTLVQWAAQSRTPGYQPAGMRWKAIGLGAGNNIAGIALDGSLHSWAPDGSVGALPRGGPRAIYGVDAAGPYESLDVGSKWGIAVDSSGTMRAFGIDAPLPMPIAPLGGVIQVAIPNFFPPPTGTASGVWNATWVRFADGTVRNLSGTVTAPGQYSRISQAGTGSSAHQLLALRTDGSIDAFRQNAWTNIAGAYRSVQLVDIGRIAIAIWDEDADGDGEPDETQILRGELPDLNGDLIDDSRQLNLDLRDADGDGAPDLAQTEAITGTTAPSSLGFGFTGFNPNPRRELWAAALRVRRGAEVVDRGFISHRLPETVPQRSGATFHVWRDPNNDGDPIDAVELLSVPIDLTGTRQAIDFPPLLLGQHGDLVFAGYSWIRQQPSGTNLFPGMFSESVPATLPGDAFAGSRVAGRMWAAFAGDLEMSPTRMLRRDLDQFALASGTFASGSMEQWSISTQLPMIALAPRRTLAGDCDRSGLLDSLDIASTAWGSSVDADGDGIVDDCQSDCDGDGIGDLDEVMSGADDCDADLVPDECRGKEGGGDCDADGEPDRCTPSDCNGNEVPDECELADGAADSNGNGILDECERDCDQDGVPDATEIGAGLEQDCDANGWIDSCESGDCDGDGLSDRCEIALAGDCNENLVPDECDIASGLVYWRDLDGNGIIDMCQFRSSLDCDGNGVDDAEQFPAGTIDCDGNGVFDACEYRVFDCDGDGAYDLCEIAGGEPDCNANGAPDACEGLAEDCDGDGTSDLCELAEGAEDCDRDGRPDECGADGDGDGRADICEALDGDLNLDGNVDAADLGKLLGEWGNYEATPFDGDLDGDWYVSGSDLGLLLTKWGRLPG
jgi:hypothetical protein